MDAADDEAGRDRLRDLPFATWDAVAALPGTPKWGGLIEHAGVTVAASRVWGTSPEEPDAQLIEPGSTVWSFAPDGLAGDAAWPVRHASLVFATRLADHAAMSLRDSVAQLLQILESGGVAAEVELGEQEPIAGRVFEVPQLGWLVASDHPGYALAAACSLMPPVLQYRPVRR